VKCPWLAELDEGLCCPLELTSVLTESFKKADQKLLSWLEGRFQTASRWILQVTGFKC